MKLTGWRALTGLIVAAAIAMAARSASSAPTPVFNPRPGASLCAMELKPAGEILPYENCTFKDRASVLHLKPEYRRGLKYDRFGLASFMMDHYGYYIRHDGRLAPVLPFDNWADDFRGGLARSPVGGKIGYIDRRLNLVIPAIYDGADKFYGGLADVCFGCHAETQNEMTYNVGGRWGCIDRHGRLQAPLQPGSVPGGRCEKLRRAKRSKPKPG